MSKRKGAASPPVGTFDRANLESVTIDAEGAHAVATWAFDTQPDYSGRMVLQVNTSDGKQKFMSQAFDAFDWDGSLDSGTELTSGLNAVLLYSTDALGNRVTTWSTQALVL